MILVCKLEKIKIKLKTDLASNTSLTTCLHSLLCLLLSSFLSHLVDTADLFKTIFFLKKIFTFSWKHIATIWYLCVKNLVATLLIIFVLLILARRHCLMTKRKWLRSAIGKPLKHFLCLRLRFWNVIAFKWNP